jgi:hypothetical protein
MARNKEQGEAESKKICKKNLEYGVNSKYSILIVNQSLVLQ